MSKSSVHPELTPMDGATAEAQTEEIVILIQETVHILRSVKEFAPAGQQSVPLDTVNLSTKFDKLLPRIRQCCQVNNDADTRDSSNQRMDIVKSVLWPLLSSLGRCYAVLDNVPPPQETLSRKNKPPPPPGMLSIQNYTDIAVFMEFLVCSSILPLLQQNILPSAQDRARYYLPKSLAGRIPRASLLWACAVQDKTTEMNASETILELRTSAAVIGSVVALDRFRPMLLPRHVVDLYAAMFQAGALEHEWKTQSTIKDNLVPLGFDRLQDLLLSSTKADANSVVDPFTQARACQALLSRGTSSPLWLRQRVSKLLNDLACRDIGAIVHVFVRSAGEDMTSASQRLARALTADLKNFAALCRQLVSLLDVPANHQVGTPVDPNQQAGILTVLAVIDQVPLALLTKHLLPLLDLVGLVPAKHDDNSDTINDALKIHRALRRVGILLSSLPSSYKSSKVGRLLLSSMDVSTTTNEPLNGAKVTIFGQLLRIASIESAVLLNVIEDAIFTFQCSVQTLMQSSFAPGGGGVEVAALAMVYCVAPTILDTRGFRYTISTGDDCEIDTYRRVTFDKDPKNAANDIPAIVHDIERLVVVIVDKVLSSLPERSSAEDVEKSAQVEAASLLPSSVFYLLLQCYFTTITAGSRLISAELSDGKAEMSNVLQGIRIYAQLIAMVLLPYLCEQCSPQSLLLTDGGGFGILSMIKLILDCTAAVYLDATDHDALLCIKVTNQDKNPYSLADQLLTDALALGKGSGDGDIDDFELPPDETLVSIASVVLTLLVTMLELGTKKRSDEEESLLTSVIPALGTLSRFRERDFRDQKNFPFRPELAEMAAHAMILIAARSQMSAAPQEPIANSKSRSLIDSISEAEKDLESEQPPVRARGIALLTRLSHKYLDEKDRYHSHPMITVVGDETKGDGKDNTYSLVLSEVVRISVLALKDTESYVYLAAIQSLVVAADASPREVIPLIGSGVSYGNISFDRVGAKGETVQLSLSSEQRIKLSEALLFTIRRRGKAIYEFVPLLMNLILNGFPADTVVDRPTGMDIRIQEETHRYFAEGNGDQFYDEQENSSREDFDLRVRTGGPIFQIEENDLLRAGCIAVLSELISSALPPVVARHCPTLVHFATTSLNLETSRPVRRATAMLCYELYSAILRDQDKEPHNGAYHSADLSRSFAVEMVSSGEEELQAALQCCVHAPASKKTRLYDPATIERCKEALQTRAEAERSGVIAAATLYLTTEQESHSRATVLVRARLNEGRKGGGNGVMKAMKGLKADSDNLEFVS